MAEQFDALAEYIANKIRELNESETPIKAANEKRTYTVTEIQDILGISRVSAYELVKKGYFHSVRIGSSIRISKPSFDAWLDNYKKEE